MHAVMLQPDGVQTGVPGAANIDTIVISHVNRLPGRNLEFFQTQAKRFRIGFGGYFTFPRDNDNPKKFFQLGEKTDAMGARGFLPLGVGDQGHFIAGTEGLEHFFSLGENVVRAFTVSQYSVSHLSS